MSSFKKKKKEIYGIEKTSSHSLSFHFPEYETKRKYHFLNESDVLIIFYIVFYKKYHQLLNINYYSIFNFIFIVFSFIAPKYD